jgi:hypothetical protein
MIPLARVSYFRPLADTLHVLNKWTQSGGTPRVTPTRVPRASEVIIVRTAANYPHLKTEETARRQSLLFLDEGKDQY